MRARQVFVAQASRLRRLGCAMLQCMVLCLWSAMALFGASVADAGPIIVRTQPPVTGAAIEVDGRTVAVTGGDGGALIENILPGDHELVLVLKDGSRIERGVTVTSGGLASQLVFQTAGAAGNVASSGSVSVVVSGNVGSATVKVDGRNVGQTGARDASLMLELSPGRHTIQLGAPRYEPQEKVVELAPGPVGRISFELKRQRGENRPAGVLTMALVAILGVAVVAVVLVAVFVVRRSPSERITTRRLDRYEMREIIGRGGMATVYRAADTTRRGAEPVALKVLDAVHLEDLDLVHKFLREGEVLMRLNQLDPEAPLVEVYHYGRAGGDHGRPFIAMELLDGEDLLRHLKRCGRLPLSEAARIVAGVARALQPAHAAGVYHRDLTPDNVILLDRPKGGYHLRLIDFGVARHEYTSHGTLDGSIAGKPPYMSPEQCQGMVVDGRSDIYALGVMLFSLLTGSPPFTHTNPLEVMRMHKENEVSYPPSMPGPVVEFLSRALAKDRAERFQEIMTVSQELQRLRQTV